MLGPRLPGAGRVETRDWAERIVVSRRKPVFLNRAVVDYLLSKSIVVFEPQEYRAIWCGLILTFSSGRLTCFQALWDNFLKGNLPINQKLVLRRLNWPGDTNFSNIFKGHPEWKRVIVGDGKGNFWLHVPRAFIPKTVEPVGIKLRA